MFWASYLGKSIIHFKYITKRGFKNELGLKKIHNLNTFSEINSSLHYFLPSLMKLSTKNINRSYNAYPRTIQTTNRAT